MLELITKHRKAHMSVIINQHTADLLLAEGYRLVDDASETHSRLTYIHNDAADRPFLLALSHSLRYAGWQTDALALRTYRLPGTRQMIEIEPGGADTSGNYLHLIEIPD